MKKGCNETLSLYKLVSDSSGAHPLLRVSCFIKSDHKFWELITHNDGLYFRDSIGFFNFDGKLFALKRLDGQIHGESKCTTGYVLL